METKPQQLKRRDDALPLLNTAISALDLARGRTNVTSAKDVFDSATVLLNTIKVGFFLAHVG